MADQKTTPNTYISNKTTVPNNKILLPCHIRFWLVKRFVKTLNHTSDALQHTCSMSPQMSEKKLRMAYSLNHRYEDAEI
jgi:hypothetical protein